MKKLVVAAVLGLFTFALTAGAAEVTRSDEVRVDPDVKREARTAKKKVKRTAKKAKRKTQRAANRAADSVDNAADRARDNVNR